MINLTPKVDCHLHTSFSPDSNTAPRKLVEHCISLGLRAIAITDHMDILYGNPDFKAMTCLKEYCSALHALKDEYADRIEIAVGIEAGWSKNNEQLNLKLLAHSDIEYVINSIHEVNGNDCYYPSHFAGRSKDEVYNAYFDAVLSSLSAPYPYDAVGHLCYIGRTAPYKNKRVFYCDYSEKLDAILLQMIKKDIILELNSNVYTSGSLSLPDFDVVKRYIELGGKLLTFSSDAHTCGRVCENYSLIAQNALDCGVKAWTYKANGKLKFIDIE